MLHTISQLLRERMAVMSPVVPRWRQGCFWKQRAQWTEVPRPPTPHTHSATTLEEPCSPAAALSSSAVLVLSTCHAYTVAPLRSNGLNGKLPEIAAFPLAPVSLLPVVLHKPLKWKRRSVLLYRFHTIICKCHCQSIKITEIHHIPRIKCHVITWDRIY